MSLDRSFDSSSIRTSELISKDSSNDSTSDGISCNIHAACDQNQLSIVTWTAGRHIFIWIFFIVIIIIIFFFFLFIIIIISVFLRSIERHLGYRTGRFAVHPPEIRRHGKFPGYPALFQEGLDLCFGHRGQLAGQYRVLFRFPCGPLSGCRLGQRRTRVKHHQI